MMKMLVDDDAENIHDAQKSRNEREQEHMMDVWEWNPVLSLNRALWIIQWVTIGPPEKHSFGGHRNFVEKW